MAIGSRSRRRNSIAEQFAARYVSMLESPAYRVLSRAAHQVLARIEIEYGHHGGMDNGKLPVTYDHFVQYGIHRHAIAPAIRELEALGFIEVTQRGVAGNADYRLPSLYRLTIRAESGKLGDGTHEWRRITSIKEAKAIAELARSNADPRAVAAGKKRKPSSAFRHRSVTISATENNELQ